jgi:hypothetical protein
VVVVRGELVPERGRCQPDHPSPRSYERVPGLLDPEEEQSLRTRPAAAHGIDSRRHERFR